MSNTATKRCKERRMSTISVSTKTKYNVQHRSDLLMDEHVRNVRQIQFELQAVLSELESAKSAEQIESLREEAATLKAKSDKLVLVLQVMGKINSELSYARNDLNDALHKGIGDINAARKRVIWLEDKMGELCGKKRLKSRRPSNRFITAPNYSFDTDSEGEQTRRMRPLDSSERMYASEQARHQSLTQLLGSEIGYTSDSEHMINRHVGFQDMSSHSYESNEISTSHTGNKGIVSSQEDVSFNTDTGPIGSKIVDRRKPLHDSMVSLTSGGHAEIAEESGSEKFSVVKEMSVVAPSPVKVTSTPDLLHDNTDLEKDEETRYDTDRDYMDENTDGHEEEEEEQERTHVTVDMPSGYDYEVDDERDYEESEDEGRGDEEEVKDDDINCSGDEEEEEQEKENNDEEIKGDRSRTTFITEVTGQTDDIQNEKEEDQMKAETPRDLGKEYWQSEHHRFEYSDFADILTAMDPLSYHQMGLAVPGSFIKREDTKKDVDELPWRPRRKGSDIKDVHRIALDKLATRVHSMYDKVYNATMLSVKGNQQGDNLPREASVFQSYEGGKGKPGSSSTRTSGDIPQTAPASIRQRTEDFLPLQTEKGVKRSGTFATGKLIFYPKPIPPPHVLPITRTSLDKEFPQFASHYAKPEPENRKPADRLVDQRNLMEETKLVLYREKIKPSTPGPTRLERKFRKMLEHDGAASNKSSGETQRKKYTKQQIRKKLQTGFKTAAVLTKLQGAVAGWNQIKPKSRGNEYSGLRWERVKTIIHKNITSERTEERIDAARQLGMLRCCDTMVFYALKERLQNDFDDRVRYEAAKSLILIGCWEDTVLQSILKYLVMGNTEIRADMISTLIQGKNVQYVDKNIPSFLELVKILSHFCQNPDPDDLIAFDSAICLGRLCIKDESAKVRLLSAMKESKQTEIRAKALEILVKQLNYINNEIVAHILMLLRESPVWRFRALACRLLISLGPKHACVVANGDEIYSLLSRKLWDDPNMDVRTAAAKALTALGWFAKACDSVERNLESADEEARSQAAISVGTLGMKSEKLIRLLLEMIELDSSDYVRLMIVRTFGVLKLTDKRVLRCLREREKLEGPLARESRRSLQVLDQSQGQVSKSLPSNLLQAQKPFSKKRVLSPIQVGVF